jgi:hypothetical protein
MMPVSPATLPTPPQSARQSLDTSTRSNEETQPSGNKLQQQVTAFLKEQLEGSYQVGTLCHITLSLNYVAGVQ